MNNHDFNIINQLVQEQKSLWRITKHYLEEAQNDEEKAMWEQIKKEKQLHIDMLKSMAKKFLA